MFLDASRSARPELSFAGAADSQNAEPALVRRSSERRIDPLAAIDIPHLLHETGDTLERQKAANGLFIFYIKRGKAWEQHFFARGVPMRRGPGAVSLLRLYLLKAMPGDRQGDG
jgi:hypothetical protein